MAQPELIKDIEARVKDTGDIMTGNLKVPDLDIASDICRGSIYGETNSLNFRGGNPTTEKYTNLKIAEDGVYIDNQKIYYPGNKPTPADIGAAISSHNHDDRYYTETEMDTLLSAKAPSAHASQHASGGSDPITPAAIGAAASSHNHSATNITSGTLAVARGGTGQTTVTPAVGMKGVRQIYAGTSDMTAGSTSLTTGVIYFVYE